MAEKAKNTPAATAATSAAPAAPAAAAPAAATTAPPAAAATAAPAAAAPATALTPPPETQALEVFDYGEDAGQGFENQDMSDRKLPIIELLQSNSPQVAERQGQDLGGPVPQHRHRRDLRRSLPRPRHHGSLLDRVDSA